MSRVLARNNKIDKAYMTIGFPKDLHKQMKMMAVERGVYLCELIIDFCQKQMDAEKGGHG